MKTASEYLTEIPSPYRQKAQAKAGHTGLKYESFESFIRLEVIAPNDPQRSLWETIISCHKEGILDTFLDLEDRLIDKGNEIIRQRVQLLQN